MRRYLALILTLLLVGVGACQNTIENEQDGVVLSAPVASAIRGVVSAPLTVPLGAARLRSQAVSGYQPVTGAELLLLLLDADGNTLARLQARTGVDGSFAVAAPLRDADLIGKIVVVMATKGDLQLGLIIMLDGTSIGSADVHPGTALLAYAELGALGNASDAAAAFRAFVRDPERELARSIDLANSRDARLVERKRDLADALSQMSALRGVAGAQALNQATAQLSAALQQSLRGLFSAAVDRGVSFNSALAAEALGELLLQLRSALSTAQVLDLTQLADAIRSAGVAALGNILQIIARSGQATPIPTPLPTVPLPTPSPTTSAVSGLSGSTGSAGGSGQTGGGGGAGL